MSSGPRERVRGESNRVLVWESVSSSKGREEQRSWGLEGEDSIKLRLRISRGSVLFQSSMSHFNCRDFRLFSLQSKVTALDVSSTSDVINSTVIPVTTVTKNTTDGKVVIINWSLFPESIALFFNNDRTILFFFATASFWEAKQFNQQKEKDICWSFVKGPPFFGLRHMKWCVYYFFWFLSGSLCWETTVGQELFKLTIIDLVALVFSVLTGDLCVSLTVRFLNCFQGRLLDLEKIVSG